MADATLTRSQSESDKRAVQKFLDAKDIAREYCQGQFDRATRWYRLFAGMLPAELEGTFSKVELQIARAMIESELPRSSRALGTTKWFKLEALEYMYEYPASAATKWLKYQMERVQNVAVTLIPTFQSTHIFGTGYRIYSVKKKVKRQTGIQPAGEEMGMPYGFQNVETISERNIISGQSTNFFNVLPLPGGGLVNAVDDTNQACADGVLWYDYPTETEIRANAERGWFRGDQVEALLNRNSSQQNHPSEQYLQQLASAKDGWNRYSMPDWVQQIRLRNKDLTKRYLVGWHFSRDRWTCVAEDNFLLYDGPPQIDAIPIAKFVGSFDLENWFGVGLLEVSEDLIISIMLNFNHRLDHLAGIMHPATYVPEALLDHHDGDKSIFDPAPYKIIPYPRTINDIARAIYTEQKPAITQQAFVEDDRMNFFLEKVTGQTDLLKGLASGQAAEGTATGVANLVNEGTARSMMRAMNMENTGLRDSLWLTLKYGKEFKNDEEWVRGVTGNGGFAWEQVDLEAITDEYGIDISGSRALQAAEETFRKQLAVAQFIIGNPVVKNQAAALRPLMESGGYDDPDEIIGEQSPANTPLPSPQGQQAGGASTPMNDMMSQMGRTGVGLQGQQTNMMESVV
jgi:hypothetical protein